MESVDFGRNLCEKYSSLPLIEIGNVFMFGCLFYKECILSEKSFTVGKETQLLIFIRVLPCLFYCKQRVNSELAVLLKIRLSCQCRFLN